MFTYRRRYFIIAVVLFIIEILIALYVNDRFIRPYVGDFLVVIFLYCLISAFLNAPMLKIALGVLLFAYVVELMQYLDFIGNVGLKNSKLVNVVLGNQFAWIDMLAYTLGIGLVIVVEKYRASSLSKRRRPS